MTWRAGAWAGAWVWVGACAGALLLSAVLALTTGWGGDVAFILGALVILASVGFIGTGGETRFRIIRNMFGTPVAVEQHDPEKRRRELSMGVKVFLLGLSLWAPLIWKAFSS